MDLAYTKSISSCRYIFIRYLAYVFMMLIPILLLPLKSFIILAKYAYNTGTPIDILAFPKYIMGGIYETFDFVIRHNTLKGYGRMMQEIHMLILNRTVIAAASLLIILFTAWIYQIKRKGGLKINVPEFIHPYKREW